VVVTGIPLSVFTWAGIVLVYIVGLCFFAAALRAVVLVFFYLPLRCLIEALGGPAYEPKGSGSRSIGEDSAGL